MGKHLVKNGFVPGYYIWTYHGESERGREEVGRERADNYDTGVGDMIDDFHDAQVPPSTEQPEPTAKVFYDMLEAARQPLHKHTKVCKLDAIGQMMALKTQYSWSRDGFDAVMAVVAGWLPEGHVLPKTLYESKKILRALKMPYEQIHACPKGCILFRKEHEHGKYCPECKSSRYVEVDSGDGQMKQLKVPVNVLRYLPVIPRIQRLYMTEETAKQMTWHKVGKRYKKDGNERQMMIHPSDGEAWKSLDRKHKDKAAEARNVRIAMSTDGFNPFGMTSASYSCWPMFVIPLNLPPDVLMQRKHMFLSLIIPGPDYPGKNMSVYMQPLMDELKEAWVKGFRTYDRATGTNFDMFVWYQYSLHDLPAFAIFVGWCVHGKFPCL